MRVLILHNRYQLPGGEDVVVQQESAMLRQSGARVENVEVDNDAITSPRERVRAAIETFYSWRMRAEVSTIIQRFRPDVMHVHNFMPRLSPSVYDAAFELGCPVVQTLHNYRLLCANALLFRDGKPCHDCLGRSFGWPGMLHRCYRSSAVGSGVIAGMTAWHRRRGTWNERVDRYIVLTQFARDLFAESGVIPVDRITVKPNAVADPGTGRKHGDYLLYVGRLTPEKGIEVLLQAAQHGGFGIPLKIAGGGPLESRVKAAECYGNIEFVGHLGSPEILQLMKGASALLFPSLCYEGLPIVIAEAFATGLPVIASRMGAMAQLVSHEKNGLLVEPGSAEGFQTAARRIASSPSFAAELQRNARATYEASYTPARNLRILLQVYEEARISAERREPATTRSRSSKVFG